MEPNNWRWANTQGMKPAISLSDLRSSLAKGKISSQAWVWQTGWKHWLPACRVPELRLALGSKAREPQVPTLDPKQTEPPRLPTEIPDENDWPRLSTPVPPPNRNQLLKRRPPAPTVNEDGFGAMPGTGTLRPPGAVPPPPRGIPKSMLRELEDWDPSAPDPTSQLEDAAPPSLQPHTSRKPSGSQPRILTDASSGREPPHGQSHGTESPIEVPEGEISAPLHGPASERSVTYDPDGTLGHGGGSMHAPVDARTSAAPTGKSRLVNTTAIALAIGAVSLLAGAWLVLSPATKSRPPPAVQPKALPPPIERPFECLPTRAAQRLSPRISMAVAPLAIEWDKSERIAIGFAESATTAAGITVDPSELGVQFPFRELSDKKLVSITPILLGPKVSFVTVREGIELAQARAVTDSVQFLFGVGNAGFSRQLQGQRPELVWSLEGNSNVTDPRIATAIGLGHAVTYRQGGQNGRIMLGFLTQTGQSFAAPTALTTTASMLGNPTVAVNASTQTIIVFAGRSSETEPWSLFASRAAWGKAPEPAKLLSLREGGPGGDAISPSMVGMPHGYWMLQWSEGQTGQRQVRVQLLDSELRPLGKAHTVSPQGSNSGQGLLWAASTRAVSFFVVSSGKQAELWASALSCSK